MLSILLSKIMTTYRRRPKHDPKESEREILQAAEKFLSERSFRELSIDEVMKLTGLKRPAFYVHFKDKYDLALKLVSNVGKELFAIADNWLKGNSPQDDLPKTLEGLVNIYLKHGLMLRAFAEAACADERVEGFYRDLIQEFIDATVSHIKEEQESGRINKDMNVEETARALVWLEERYLSEAFGRIPQGDPEIVVQVLHNIWLSTLYNSN